MDNQPDLLFLLHDLARQLRTDADRRAAAHGMTRAQWVALFWLRRRPGLSQKELAELLEIEPISAGRLVDRLEARGMLERRQDPADRRIWRLHLLPDAQPVLDELNGEREAMHAMTVAGIDPNSLRVVRETLAQMKANVVAGCSRTRPSQPERNVA
ncbi:MAG TPA: MarR family transcriptional regulator [Acetobacteraceae bacterium]|nr:MarR family transcriptional regulator [Acetobacteraceae bacterium]